MAHLRVGAIIGRFQLPEPHSGHHYLFQHVAANSDRVVCLLGCSVLDGYSAGYELTFAQRYAVLSRLYPDMLIMPLHDMNDNGDWSQQVDRLLTQTFPHAEITLYGGRLSFLDSYKGSLPTTFVETRPVNETSGTAIRQALKEENEPAFLRGQIHALNRLYPVAYRCVDVAVTRAVVHGADAPTVRPQDLVASHDILLIQRKDNGKWVFPGGFVDPKKDTCDRDAAVRELVEETGITFANGVDSLRLVDDGTKMDDWRFRASPHKIFSVLYTGPFAFGAITIDPTEVTDYRWVNEHKDARSVIADVHKPFMNALLEYFDFNRNRVEMSIIRDLDRDAEARRV